ncbi:ABC transporter permease subunit [Saccharibacillus sacchari]|uniref:ABC transporter permease subunit n=1 Tax=Saccharibacillus sacchari TaxID=456493 RepID=A0ACC6P8Z1_9BACL
MRQLTAFIGKEGLEVIRTGKATILALVFILFGILNPAIAKLTPWMFALMSESMAGMGLSASAIEVNALTSWAQFYKNAPLVLIVFLLLFAGILTRERSKGTLVPLVTKGLNRWAIIASKGIVLVASWSIGYWVCYGITYGYTAYFWDNGAASHLLFSAFCVYVLGVWLISLILPLSIFLASGSGVMLGVGGLFAVVYVIGLLPEAAKYLPTRLLEASTLIQGTGRLSEYAIAIGISLLWSALNICIAALLFKRQAL